VYAGANGEFTLYEDDGLTYNYEKGMAARIPIHWDNASKTITIGKREGAFPEMLAERTFGIVLVSKTNPVEFSLMRKPDRSVHYNGEQVAVKLD
jgi:alpha-D-xyloside xylohydrolase